MYPTLDNNFICSSQKLGAIQISINNINKKLACQCQFNGIPSKNEKE